MDLVGEEGRAGGRRRGGAAGQRDRSRGGVGGSTDGGSREAQAWGGEGRGGEASGGRRPDGEQAAATVGFGVPRWIRP